MKIKVNDKDRSQPLLRDILIFLEKAFEYVLENLKPFYNHLDKQIAYLVLYQEPMINGLNTGGFELHNKDDAKLMVERVLKMLYQYLISNQTLKLDETFKVYLKILSVDHLRYKEANSNKRKHPKRNKNYYATKKKHFGTNNNENSKKMTYFWSIDVPDSFNKEPISNVFKNKCLLVTCILGLLQNNYFYSNRVDKRFLKAQQILSKSSKLKNEAGKIIYDELLKLFKKTNLKTSGPYQLEDTAKCLSQTYNCQIIVFSGMSNSQKLFFMYPPSYDDSMIPIYLYQPPENDSHFIYIRHLNSYFRANGKICLACGKRFSNMTQIKHLCPKLKVCFCCRRYYQNSNTYIHERLSKFFCDEKLSNEKSIICQKCNLTIYSKNCMKAHSSLCSGKGYFGYSCSNCKKFTYCYKSKSSENLKQMHQCGDLKPCNFCFEPQEKNHLCKMKQEIISTQWPRLAFISAGNYETIQEKCYYCLHDNIVCASHCIETEASIVPFIFIIYREEIKRCNFTEYVFSNDLDLKTVDKDILFYQYDSTAYKHPFFNSKLQKSNKVLQDFSRNYEILFSLQDKSLGQQILQFTMDKDFQNTTYVCQDSQSSTFMFLLKTFLENGFVPIIVRKFRKILVIEIKELRLRFITSNAYINGSEYDLANHFNVKFDQYYFPQSFMAKENFCYVGTIPDIKYFECFLDSSNEISKKTLFLSTFSKISKHWVFQKELLIYLKQKIFLLSISFLRFIHESFTFQSSLFPNIPLLHPICFPLCTISGFTYKLLKCWYWNNEEIFCVANEFHTPMRKVGKYEEEWTSFMQFTQPNLNFESEFSSPSGQRFWPGHCVPDLYSAITKECFFFNECKIHGHENNCLIDPKASPTKTIFGKTYKEHNEIQSKKFEHLLLSHPNDVEKITIIWECQFKKMKENLPEMILFFSNVYISHPLIRLRPRSCVRSGFNDVYALKFSKTLFPKHTLKFFDINGSYSFSAIQNKFMIGKYKVLMGNDLKELEFKNNEMYYKNKIINGSLLLTILPPKNLYRPFLLYQTTDGRSLNTLCKSCCEYKITVCNHNNSERALTGCYMISEIIFALKLNYSILSIHECHAYFKSDYILRDYIKALNFFKTKHTNLFENCKTLKEKEDYCSKLNKELLLTEPFLLKPHLIEPNHSKRNFFKLMMNATFGKIESKNDKSKTIFVSSQSEIENIYFSDQIVQDIFCINSNFCQLNVKPDQQKLPINRLSNCYIGAQLTAFSRQLIYENIIKLEKLDCNIFLTDTDSLLFSYPSNLNCPLVESHCLGDFKDEYSQSEITNFYSLGPKNYVLTLKCKDKVETITKVRGLCLSSLTNKNLMNETLFEFYIDEYKKKFKCLTKVNQYRIKANFKNFSITPNILPISFSNEISSRRYLKVDENNLVNPTYPYGYETTLK